MTFKVDATPEVLEWARKSIGLSLQQAAQRVKVSAIQIQEWEEGIGEPSFAQLRRMANAYKRPVAVLLLSSPPEGFEPIRDFRLLPENQNREWSPELHAEFRRVQVQREVARELATDEQVVPLTLSVQLDDDPDNIGNIVRAWLIGTQSVKNELNWWIGLIENKAILVTQIQDVDLTEMRGCSLSDEPFPTIILNGKDTQRGKLFTLLHELTHILLRLGGLCDLAEVSRDVKTETQRIERFCNQVAAATLIPRDALLHNAPVASATVGYRWTDDELANLARPFGVSQEAMLRRLVSLGRASWDYYIEKRANFLTLYADMQRRQKEKQEGGPSYYTMKLRDLGRRYISTVLDAYHQDRITGSDLAGYLSMKLDNLPQLEAVVEGRR